MMGMDHNSSLFFWWWPADYQDIAHKGVLLMFLCPPPQSRNKQPKYQSKERKVKVKKKLEKVMQKGYIEIAAI